MRYHSLDRDTFEIVDDDPTSATVVARRSIELSRGDWRTKVAALGKLTCDKELFHVHTEVTAYHGDEAIFERAWHFTAPRDLT